MSEAELGKATPLHQPAAPWPYTNDSTLGVGLVPVNYDPSGTRALTYRWATSLREIAGAETGRPNAKRIKDRIAVSVRSLRLT